MSAQDLPAADEPVLSYGIETDLASRYVWHGIPYSEGAVLEPSAWASAKDFTFWSWANVPLAGEGTAAGPDEIDLGLSWSKTWGATDLEPGFQVYAYPNQQDAPATGVVTLDVASGVGPLIVSTTHELDVVQYPGAYVGSLSASFEREASPDLELEITGGVGWSSSSFNDVYLGVHHGGLRLVTAGLASTLRPMPNVYLRPHVDLSVLLDGDAASGLERPTQTVFGLALGTEF